MIEYPGWTLEDFWCRGMFEDACRTLSIPRYIIAEIFRVYDQRMISSFIETAKSESQARFVIRQEN